ncbi:alpha/beta-hydrolase [Thozetella sp. PMI_491]|nr:alpha/beta-hydrolase [Thozetella sp. PMI_491]
MVEYVDINGAKLAYRIAGPEEAPLIITLHGGRGMGSRQLSCFQPPRPDYRVLSFDYRGHGQSSRTKPYTFAQIVEDIESVRIHFAGPDKKVIILGGMGYLILRGTARSYHQEEDAMKALEERAHRAPNVTVKMLKEKVFGAFESDLEFQLVYFAMAPAPQDDDLYTDKEKFFDDRNDLHKITAKTLIVVGDQDWICSPVHSKIIASKVPRAELVVYEGANHSVIWERPAEALERIREFLS